MVEKNFKKYTGERRSGTGCLFPSDKTGRDGRTGGRNELRIDVVKQHIQDSVADDRKRIAELKEHVETLDYDKRESTWEEIDTAHFPILK